MTLRGAIVSVAVMLLIVMSGLSSLPVRAETPVQSNFDTRTMLTFTAPPAAVEKWLTTPWRLEPIGAGPLKDANFLLVFLDRVGDYAPDGKPVDGVSDRSLVLVVPAKHAQTGENAFFVSRVYTSNPRGIPGPYKNSVLSQVRYEHAVKWSDNNPAVVSEQWEVRDASGGAVELKLQYARGPLNRARAEQKIRGGPDPNFFRIYRVDQAVDLLKSVPAQIDRTQRYELKVTMPDLRPTFDGSEKLVSIGAIPLYVRQVALP